MARKKGSTNVKEKHINTVAPSRCRNPECQSTRRTEYEQKRVLENGGLDNDGKPYTRVIYRRTKCLDCGQVRDDRTYEFEPDCQAE